MSILKALSKQLFGAKYERIWKSLISCLVLFFAIHATEIRVKITPSILFLTVTVFSAGIMWQALNSSQNANSLVGMFMLPFTKTKMSLSVVLAFTSYTLITATSFVLTLFFAICKWSAVQITVSLLCACNGCFMVAAWYTMTMKRKLLPFVFLWCVAMLLSVFLVQRIAIFAFIIITSLLLSAVQLLTVDAYVFYRPVSAKLLIKHTRGAGGVFLYLLRYLITNKNYLFNTAGLCVIAGVMPFILGQFKDLNVMPLGFPILCLNTPICILLSCDPSLEQAVRVLPRQASRFFTPYCLFIFFVNMAISSVYLISWHIQYGSVGGMEIITALLFALQSAILSVLLEWRHPIRNWKIESDLWHHPRKYIVPLVMLLIAGLIGMWSVSIWVLLCIVLAECFSLPLIVRRV